MTGKQCVLAALDHRQPDRVPIDFGGTAVTGIHVTCVAALRDYYGLEKRPVKIHEPYQMLGWIDEDLAVAMRLDVAAAFAPKTIFGFAAGDWKPWSIWGLDVLVPGQFNTRIDTNGDLLIYPEGDTNVPPSGRMPGGSFFFDSIIRQQAFDEDSLDPEHNLEEFTPIGEGDLAAICSAVGCAGSTGRAVILGLPGTALGDIALVPAPFLKHPRGIRDVAEWYMSTRSRQHYLHAVFERQCEIAVGNLERIKAAVGDTVDAVFTCGTDFGTQTSSFCSVSTFRELYLPHYRRVNDWIHGNTRWRVFKHSCGAVEKFMESFIEAGFDIINPVQCSAAGMDPARLKDTYGSRVVFWGGGVDTQKTLPFGRPQQVREEVLRRCEIFALHGGFVFNSIHNVQAGTPLENIVAMLDAIHEFNGTPRE